MAGDGAASLASSQLLWHLNASVGAVMDAKDRRVFGLFVAAVRRHIPDAEIWAYGSRVRGDADGLSGLDVCVVVPERTDEVWKWVADAAWEVGFDNGIVIVPVTIASESFHNGPLAASGLARAVLGEGVAA